MAKLSGSTAPIRVGESRTFSINTRSLARVGIKCFVRPPDPPEFRECPECGVINDLADGQQFTIHAPPDAFLGHDGGIEIEVSEPGVPTEIYRIVLDRGESTSQLMADQG